MWPFTDYKVWQDVWGRYSVSVHSAVCSLLWFCTVISTSLFEATTDCDQAQGKSDKATCETCSLLQMYPDVCWIIGPVPRQDRLCGLSGAYGAVCVWVGSYAGQWSANKLSYVP